MPLTWKKCVLHVCVQHRLFLELDPSVCHVERSQQVKAAKEGQTGQGQTGQTEATRRAERAKPRQPSQGSHPSSYWCWRWRSSEEGGEKRGKGPAGWTRSGSRSGASDQQGARWARRSEAGTSSVGEKRGKQGGRDCSTPLVFFTCN